MRIEFGPDEVVIVPQRGVAFFGPHWKLRKITMVMPGHSWRPIEFISFIEIPNAPSPANPTTGTSGHPIVASIIAGKP